jgi:hypothetical protein
MENAVPFYRHSNIQTQLRRLNQQPHFVFIACHSEKPVFSYPARMFNDICCCLFVA